MTRYEITVGIGKDKDGKDIKDADKRLNVVRAHFIAEFGGFSEIALRGGYRMASGDDVREPCVRFEIVTAAKGGAVRRWASILRDLFHQESVLFTRTSLDEAKLV